MSVSRMPRAPRSYSSSISRWAPARGTIARTATQPSRCSGETVGLSMPGVSAHRLLDPVGGDVVVHHHVGAGHQDALEPAPEHLEALGLGRAGAGDQHRLGLQDHLAERSSSPACRSVLPVSTTSAITSATPSWMLVSTAPSSRVTVASMPRSSRNRRTTPAYDVAIRLPARSVEVGVRPGRAGEVERRAAEAEREHLLGLGAGVEQQVAAGDADVEGALADVQRDVARAQVEELDAVLGVDEGELLGVGRWR